MKKGIYLSVILLVMIATSSLSSINEKTKESTADFGQDNCISRFARSSSCEGCHGGTGTNGPIIIIYTDGKKGPYSIPIEQGKTEVVLVNEASNTIAIEELRAYLVSHNIDLLEVSNSIKYVKPEFYDIHGLKSEDILKNIQFISINSTINQSLEIKKPSIKAVNVIHSSQENISLSIDMGREKQTILSVYDINGKLIKNEDILLEKGLNNIDFAIKQGLSGGYYLLEVKNNEDQICKKIMIQ